MSTDDKWLERLKILIKLIEAVDHFKCSITVQDKNVIKIEKIETEAEIKR